MTLTLILGNRKVKVTIHQDCVSPVNVTHPKAKSIGKQRTKPWANSRSICGHLTDAQYVSQYLALSVCSHPGCNRAWQQKGHTYVGEKEKKTPSKPISWQVSPDDEKLNDQYHMRATKLFHLGNSIWCIHTSRDNVCENQCWLAVRKYKKVCHI